MAKDQALLKFSRPCSGNPWPMGGERLGRLLLFRPLHASGRSESQAHERWLKVKAPLPDRAIIQTQWRLPIKLSHCINASIWRTPQPANGASTPNTGCMHECVFTDISKTPAGTERRGESTTHAHTHTHSLKNKAVEERATCARARV